MGSVGASAQSTGSAVPVASACNAQIGRPLKKLEPFVSDLTAAHGAQESGAARALPQDTDRSVESACLWTGSERIRPRRLGGLSRFAIERQVEAH
jgi:hypothetical protein